MDDLDELQAVEFITDTDDQDSLDERIDSEQRLRNQQLWASFQNAACCITKLYKDRAQPNISPWIPFQNAASNLTTLYKDCIESQKRFARIGYQVGKRRRTREIAKLLKKHQVPANKLQDLAALEQGGLNTGASNNLILEDSLAISSGQQHNNVTSILAVNKLNLGCDDSPFHSMQAQPSNNQLAHLPDGQQSTLLQQQPQSTLQILHGNNEDDLVTFQQALAQPAAIKGIKLNQNRRQCSNPTTYLNNRAIDPKSEEERLLELNQFLSEEYHRHVGSRKRSCSNLGGNPIKRLRE